MSAGKSRHEYVPKKYGQPINPPARFSSRMPAMESQGDFALPPQFPSNPSDDPETALPGAPEQDETAARLMHIIQGTELAARLATEMQTDDPPTRASRADHRETPSATARLRAAPTGPRAGSAVTSAAAFLIQTPSYPAPGPLMPVPRQHPARKAAETFPSAATRPVSPPSRPAVQPPSAPVLLRTALGARAASTRLIQTLPHAPSTLLMPPPGAPSLRRVPPQRPKTIGSPRVTAAPQVLFSPRPAASFGPGSEVMPLSSLPAISEASPGTLILAWCLREGKCLSEKALRVLDRSGRAATQLSTQLGMWTGNGAALLLLRMRRGIYRTATGLSAWIRTSVLPEIEHTGRISRQVSARLIRSGSSKAVLALGHALRISKQQANSVKTWGETTLPFELERISRHTKQLSAGFKNWSALKLAQAGKPWSQASTQHATAHKKSIAVRPAPATEITRRTSTQPTTSLKYWLGPRRRSRQVAPPVVAYCWTADTPHSLKVADISSSGVYLLTDVRWPRGATVSMTLQRTDRGKHTPDSWLVTDFLVVRWGKNGLAGAFVPPPPYSAARGAENYADPKTLKRFVKHLAVCAH